MKKRLIAIGLIVTVMLGVTGCSGGKSKADLERENAAMLDMLKENENKIASLEALVKSLTGSEPKNVIESLRTDSINEINKVLILPAQLVYKGSTEAPGTGTLNISQNVSIVPSNNWVVKSNGSTAELGHKSGIYGVIKVGTIKDVLQPDVVESDVLKPFYSKFTTSSLSVGNIFVGDVCWGKQVVMQTKIGDSDGVVQAGALGVGGTSVVYTFTYKGQYDSTKSELINILLKSMKVNNMPVNFN